MNSPKFVAAVPQQVSWKPIDLGVADAVAGEAAQLWQTVQTA